jgi:uncharacterized membrane protein (DUF485 family)
VRLSRISVQFTILFLILYFSFLLESFFGEMKNILLLGQRFRRNSMTCDEGK